MPRVFVIKKEADLQVLSSSLLSGRLSDTQTTSALEALQTLNPHVDLKKVAAGTVLLVPDDAGFKVSASDSVVGDALRGFQQLVRGDLTNAARKLKAGNAARAEQRAEVLTLQKSAAFKKIAERDPQVKQQLDEATKAMKADEQQAAQSEETLDAATKGVMAELEKLAKLIG